MPRRLITAGYVGLILAGGWAVNHASEQRSDQKLRTLQRACEQFGNPGRALDRLDSTSDIRMLREGLQPIVDCHRTYFERSGTPVPLPANEQARYVEFIRVGIRPVIRADGSVVAPQ